MNRRDEPTDNPLASIDLHAWRVPPAAGTDRAAILSRALSPASAPRRSRMRWMFAAAVGANVVLAAILVIIISRPPRTIVALQPAGGPARDAQVTSLLRRLDAQLAEVERRRAELDNMRSTVVDLESRLQRCERAVTIAKPPRRSDDTRDDSRKDTRNDTSCDEVSCVLSNYQGTCCAKFPRPQTSAPQLPEGLDRQMISGGILAVRQAVTQCGDDNPVSGSVKVRVSVAPTGKVTSVVVDRTPDAQLGECVAAAIQRAVFSPTQLGGSFSYPFVF
jgi:TonB family protein